MADAGFFKGTSAEQDSRFANKQKKLLQQMKFPDNINVKIDMLKVNLDVMKPWITKRLQELLGIEDDVVIEFVFNQLEDKHPDPKMMQINLTGFLGGSKARLFIGELWRFLASAQISPDGIPIELVEIKKKELLKRQEDDDRLREIRKREEESQKIDMNKVDYQRRRSLEKHSRPTNNENNRRHDVKKSPSYTRQQRAHSSSTEKEKFERKKHSLSNSKKKIDDVSNDKIKRTRSTSSSTLSVVEIEKEKKAKKKSQSTTRHRSRSRSLSDHHRHHKSRKHSKSSSRKHHHHSHESKRKYHRGKLGFSHLNQSEDKPLEIDSKWKSIINLDHRESTTKNHRKQSTKKKDILSSPKKPRLESQIRVQTPPPPPPPPVENQVNSLTIEQSQEVPVKSTRTVLLEESRSDQPRTLSSRVSIVTKSISNDESSEIPHNSDDESEIDLRERLLREKAIKSMKRRQLSSQTNSNEKHTITDRIVYENAIDNKMLLH